MVKENILNFDLKELEQYFLKQGRKKFHARQIFTWIYKKDIRDFSLMSDLSAELRKELAEEFTILDLELVQELESRDGTRKLLFKLKDGQVVEAVSIPTEKRITGCISTQVGCKFSCAFCASGLMGFKRNLETGEIIAQVLFLKGNLSERINNLVFMGIGEPLDNYDNVLKAIRIINAASGLGVGARKITISSAGFIPGIKRLMGEGLQIELSVSIHAADNTTRNLLMPINKKYPLPDLMRTLKEYIQKTNRQVTFEYILIAGVNSGITHAQNLSKMLRGLNCKVNLIPCNPVKELGYEPPGKLEILLFKDHLLKAGIDTTLRLTRGRDIQAACGQLRMEFI
ncbi:MAG: 23S rRNA (adenine(2503)-C(2))-methyltransferase RlmN [Candidatus Omnitrophica bacterium]|nr:23S rRNA (adenine(2503)-C(2))-methyltransferase RlmN [Candidatus Omnitrophota bacterium]MDD5610728.1 23S rRNA (adenine(2503)-C(2))-methyltransferase RlmN [Candidatus Omnitrophota bacterium]